MKFNLCMEARDGISGVTVIGAEAPSAYHVAPRSENPSQFHVHEAAPPIVNDSPVAFGLDGMPGKKKRGRPRKYGPDGSGTMALSPMLLSASTPPANSNLSSGKRGRASGVEHKKQKQLGMEEHLGEMNGASVGTNFMPHIITVNAGEDITMKVISFSQQGPRAICILSATGVISHVTLRQPDSSGGTLTYEGRFDILSLSGSFMPSETQGTRSRSGGMSVSLASPDGRVVGGGVAGLLVAASPVQVVVGSFLPSNHQEQKVKKLKNDFAGNAVSPCSIVVTTLPAEKEDGMVSHVLQDSGTVNSGPIHSNLNSSANYRRENWVTMQTMPDSRKSATDINISLPDS